MGDKAVIFQLFLGNLVISQFYYLRVDRTTAVRFLNRILILNEKKRTVLL